jgi:hypothetical protein
MSSSSDGEGTYLFVELPKLTIPVVYLPPLVLGLHLNPIDLHKSLVLSQFRIISITLTNSNLADWIHFVENYSKIAARLEYYKCLVHCIPSTLK